MNRLIHICCRPWWRKFNTTPTPPQQSNYIDQFNGDHIETFGGDKTIYFQ